jgi:hypothetical protein
MDDIKRKQERGGKQDQKTAQENIIGIILIAPVLFFDG